MQTTKYGIIWSQNIHVVTSLTVPFACKIIFRRAGTFCCRTGSQAHFQFVETCLHLPPPSFGPNFNHWGLGQTSFLAATLVLYIPDQCHNAGSLMTLKPRQFNIQIGLLKFSNEENQVTQNTDMLSQSHPVPPEMHIHQSNFRTCTVLN